MSEKTEHNKLDSDCTLPPDHPLPPDQLGRYSPTRDFYAEKDIAKYVLSQARDETVQNVERVKTEYVMGAPYEIWDVSTDKDRWWVITNPTNLYSQRLWDSGVVEGQLGSDELLVEDIYRAMVQARQA